MGVRHKSAIRRVSRDLDQGRGVGIQDHPVHGVAADVAKAYIAAVESSKDKFSTRVRCGEYLAQQGNPVSKALPGHYIAP